jgi:hypothetical protein
VSTRTAAAKQKASGAPPGAGASLSPSRSNSVSTRRGRRAASSGTLQGGNRSQSAAAGLKSPLALEAERRVGQRSKRR